MADETEPGKFYKLISSYTDPDELSELCQRERSSLAYSPGKSVHAFDYKLHGGRTDETLIISSASESGYEMRTVGAPLDYIGVHFIDSGQVSTTTTAGKIVEAQRGECYLQRVPDLRFCAARPNTTKTAVFIPTTQFVRLVATDVDDPFAEFEKLAPVVDMALPQIMTMRRIASVLCTTDELDNPLQHSPSAASLLTEAMLEVLIEAWPRLSSSDPGRYSPSPRHVKRAVEWIHANLRSRIQLEEIAEAAGASIRTLQVGFQRQFGMSPITYVTKRRLQMVHQELVFAPPERTVSEIANEWGFFHLGEFAAKYKRLYGQSPSETRRRRGR